MDSNAKVLDMFESGKITLNAAEKLLKAMNFIVHDDGLDRWKDIRKFYADADEGK